MDVASTRVNMCDTVIPNINRIRALQGVDTQEQFCARCGIARMTLFRIYRGHRVQFETIQAIANAYLLKDVDQLIKERVRVEWEVMGGSEIFRILAEKDAEGWKFWDRSVWEVRWYPLTASAELVAKAEDLVRVLRTL